MLVIIARFCILGALLLPFFRIGEAQAPTKAIKCYVCNASRQTYKDPYRTTVQPTTLSSSNDTTNSTDPTALTTNSTTSATTSVTGSSSTQVMALAEESEKSPVDDPCWDPFTATAKDKVPQMDCAVGVCFKHIIKNSPAGDLINRTCGVITKNLPVYNYNECTDVIDKNSTYSARLRTIIQRSAGIIDVSCLCNTDGCNAATSLFSSPLVTGTLVSLLSATAALQMW